MSAESEQIAAWAKEQLDIELTPWQVQHLEAILEGKVLISARQGGRTTVLRVAERWRALQDKH